MNILGEYYNQVTLAPTNSKKRLLERGIDQFTNLCRFLGTEPQLDFQQFISPLFEIQFIEKGFEFEGGKNTSMMDVYFILDGYVNVYDRENMNSLIAVLNTGNLLGSIDSLLMGQPSPFKFLATTRVVAMHLSPKSVAIIENSKYKEFFDKLTFLMALKVMGYLKSLHTILAKDTVSKIELFNKKFPAFADNISGRAIAEILRMQPETYSRACKVLENKEKQVY